MSCVPWSNESERADYWKSAWSTERAENERLQEELKIYRGFPNEPLTLDELRGMYMQPVWCDWVNQWVIINIDAQSRLEFTYCDGSQNTYDELVSCGIEPLAYRRPPERSNNEQQV